MIAGLSFLVAIAYCIDSWLCPRHMNWIQLWLIQAYDRLSKWRVRDMSLVVAQRISNAIKRRYGSPVARDFCIAAFAWSLLLTGFVLGFVRPTMGSFFYIPPSFYNRGLGPAVVVVLAINNAVWDMITIVVTTVGINHLCRKMRFLSQMYVLLVVAACGITFAGMSLVSLGVVMNNRSGNRINVLEPACVALAAVDAFVTGEDQWDTHGPISKFLERQCPRIAPTLRKPIQSGGYWTGFTLVLYCGTTLIPILGIVTAIAFLTILRVMLDASKRVGLYYSERVVQSDPANAKPLTLIGLTLSVLIAGIKFVAEVFF